MKIKNKNDNLPKNHSIWVVFHKERLGQSKWFNNKKDANLYYKYAYRQYSKPIKYTIDY